MSANYAFPFHPRMRGTGAAFLGGLGWTVLDNTAEAHWCFGRVSLEGGPGTSKTLSAAGGGKIGWLSYSSITWATPGSTVRVGITGVSTTAGPRIQSDGSYSVYKDLVQGTDAIATSTWYDTAMGSGTVTLTHGDLICIAFEMTVKNGADSVGIRSDGGFQNETIPCTMNFISPSTYTPTNQFSNQVLTFDDGTLGWLDDCLPWDGQGSLAFNSGTAGADEYGNIFQVPRAATVDQLWAKLWNASVTGGVKIILYSDPLGTPAVLASATLDYHQQLPTSAFASWFGIPLASTVNLSANTNYAVSVQPQTTSNTTLFNVTVNNANHLKAWPGGTNCYAVKRLDNAGAFATDSTAKRWSCGVRFSDYGTAGGSSSILVPRGMNGGIQ